MKNEEFKTKSTQLPSARFKLVETLTGRRNAQLLPVGLIRPIPQWTHTGDHLHQPALRRLSRDSAAGHGWRVRSRRLVPLSLNDVLARFLV